MLSAIHGLTLTYSGGRTWTSPTEEGTWFASSARLGARHPDPDPDLRALAAPFSASCWPRRHSGARSMRSAATARRPPSRASRGRGWSSHLPDLGLLRRHGRPDPGQPHLGAQNTVGQGMELEVLAAVILGGASLLGGSGTIFKTVIGVLILGFIQNGLLLAGLAVLRPVRRDLDHHHPRGLAGHRHQARKALVADRLRRGPCRTKRSRN
jgi:ribose transport system permease protein